MRFNVMKYLIGEGIRGIFKNKKSTMSTLVIMCAAMFIFGLFFVIGENINEYVKSIADAQGIRVFIADDATEQEIENIGNDILSIEGVRNAVVISKEEALETMEEWLGPELIEGYRQNNIFPVSYEVTLTDLELTQEVQENIRQIAKVEDIRSSNEDITLVINLAKGVKIVTAVILILLIIISTAIISNTIKLAVHARRKEISIMKYVGATNSFIRFPFLIGGILIGVLGGFQSIVLVGVVYTYIADQMAATTFMQMIQWQLVPFKDMFNLILTVYLGLGIGIGAIGSGISMRKYLDV